MIMISGSALEMAGKVDASAVSSFNSRNNGQLNQLEANILTCRQEKQVAAKISGMYDQSMTF